jgi:enamine deaminase RidA (YjgF/YER057c/UK114 family)
MSAIPLPPLLELATAQLEMALQNSNAQVEQLASSVDALSKLGAALRAHQDPAVAEQGARILAESLRAMFAMQFHDLLAQRLEHVRDALGDMRDALGAKEMLPARALLGVIRARYTMEDERHLFDALFGPLADAQARDTDDEPEALRGGVEMF